MFEINEKSNEELVVMAHSLALILRPAIAGEIYGGQNSIESYTDGDSIRTIMNGVVAIDFTGDIRNVIEQEILPHAVALWEVSDKRCIRTAVEQTFGLDVLAVVKEGEFPALDKRQSEELMIIPDNVRQLLVPTHNGGK